MHAKVEDVDHDEDAESWQSAWDDVTGAMLDPKEVKKARCKEIQYIKQKQVRTKISRSEANRKGIKIVKGRWIDVNKGDAHNPIFWSRYVAKEVT